MSSESPITCPVDKWYYKRMGLLSLMLIAFMGWFIYDATVGYPKKAAIYQEKVKWDERVEERVQYKSEDRLEEWTAKAKAENYPNIDDEGGARTWASYSKEKGYDEDPDKVVEGDIKEQWHFAIGFGVAAALVGLIVLLNRNKKLTADADSWTTPNGTRIPFSSISEIDKRKWDNKGLAYLKYSGEDGAEKKATLDDLKYTGAFDILERIMENFDGELVETVIEDDEEEEDDDENSES